MSRVESKPQVENPAFAAAAQNQVNQANQEFKPVTQTTETRQNRAERDNDDSRRTERRGLVGGLCNSLDATVGDVVDIVDDDGEKRRGRVVKDDDGDLTVTYDKDGDGKHESACHYNRDNGHCWGWRKSTVEEMDMAAATTEMQRANVIQEQRIDSTIETARIEHSRKLEDRKKESLREEFKQIEMGLTTRQSLDNKRTDYNDALEIQFQTNIPDDEYQAISVSQVLLGQEAADALKK